MLNVLHSHFWVVLRNCVSILHYVIYEYNYRARRGYTDVWENLATNWTHFYWLTGETPESLQLLVQRLRQIYFIRPMHRNCKLTFCNQILLIIIWMRRYPTFQHLAMHFNVGLSTVHDCIYRNLPYLHTYLVQNFIRWHTMPRWRNLVGTFPDWPNCVAILDGTCFRISKPVGTYK